MDLIQTGSTQIFGKFILWGIIIFIFFTILRFGIPYILKNQKRQAYVKQFLLTFEITVWIFYLSWFIFLFLKSRSFFVIIVFAILLFVLYVVGRLWLIDLIAGVIFKSGRQLKKGDFVEKDEYKGIVNKLGSRFLVLENIDGNMIHIPYHSITSSVFQRNETIDQKSGYSFELETKNIGTLEETKSNIQKSILSLPWSSIHKFPVITVLDQTPVRFRLKITVFALDKSFGSKIENHIKKQYAG
ncbi:MAG: mechanosensitive ion channel family protein [Bacteroidales bacterium]|nr:mechanosensitive ion channel family protein [Bacteroidales bacterium]